MPFIYLLIIIIILINYYKYLLIIWQIIITLCSSRKYPYPTQGRSSETPRGRGVLKATILEAKYRAKLEFPGGRGGAKQKTFCGGDYGYFLELHITLHKISFGVLQMTLKLCFMRLNLILARMLGKLLDFLLPQMYIDR